MEGAGGVLNRLLDDLNDLGVRDGRSLLEGDGRAAEGDSLKERKCGSHFLKFGLGSKKWLVGLIYLMRSEVDKKMMLNAELKSYEVRWPAALYKLC